MDTQEQELLREIMRQLGRCLSLTIIASVATGGVEDRAIEAMDHAWETLADDVAFFARGEYGEEL